MLAIAREAEEEPEVVKVAPTSRPVRRVDEVKAAKHPVVRYLFDEHPTRVDQRARATVES
jgi:glycine dehydrogenase subunit 2